MVDAGMDAAPPAWHRKASRLVDTGLDVLYVAAAVVHRKSSRLVDAGLDAASAA